MPLSRFAPFALVSINKSVIGEAGLRDAKACDGLSEATNNDARGDSTVRGAAEQNLEWSSGKLTPEYLGYY